MRMIKGITVILKNKTQTGTDAFNAPIYEETEECVENVIVAPALADEVISTLELYGKKAVYTLGIPKGDTHNWENRKIEFFGETWKSFGIPLKGMDDLIPGKWNQKVMVERYG